METARVCAPAAAFIAFQVHTHTHLLGSSAAHQQGLDPIGNFPADMMPCNLTPIKPFIISVTFVS
jgi:hypothetical protein